MRRLTLAGISAALIIVLAGCGGGSASPSASDTATEAPSSAEVTEAPIETTGEATPDATAAPATGEVLYAACANVAVRKGPAADKKLVVRLAKGSKVRVVDTVSGTAYKTGSCGDSGDTWVKISRISGKSVQDKYGVEFVYAAAGLFSTSKP
jgi:uncharacterized protein YgiM (DUF1202 family)